MLQRPLFNHIVSLVKTNAQHQAKEGKVVSIHPHDYAKVSLKVGDKLYRASRSALSISWEGIARQAGLVNDNTGTNTWTLPGHGYFDHHPDALERRRKAAVHSMSDKKRTKLINRLQREKKSLGEVFSKARTDPDSKEAKQRSRLVAQHNKNIRRLKRNLGYK